MIILDIARKPKFSVFSPGIDLLSVLQEDKVNLVTRTETLKRFSREVVDTTAAQSKEIGELKAEGRMDRLID